MRLASCDNLIGSCKYSPTIPVPVADAQLPLTGKILGELKYTFWRGLIHAAALGRAHAHSR